MFKLWYIYCSGQRKYCGLFLDRDFRRAEQITKNVFIWFYCFFLNSAEGERKDKKDKYAGSNIS